MGSESTLSTQSCSPEPQGLWPHPWWDTLPTPCESASLAEEIEH